MGLWITALAIVALASAGGAYLFLRGPSGPPGPALATAEDKNLTPKTTTPPETPPAKDPKQAPPDESPVTPPPKSSPEKDPAESPPAKPPTAKRPGVATQEPDDRKEKASDNEKIPPVSNKTSEKPPKGPGEGERWETTERLVLDAATAKKAHVPTAGLPPEVWVSQGGKHVAYLVNEKNEQWMVIDGKPGKRYEKCRPLDLFADRIFFGDGRTIYVGDRGDKQVVVVDGVEIGSYDSVAFKDGQSYVREGDNDFSFIAGIAKPTLVVNGKEAFTPKIFWGGNNATRVLIIGPQVAWSEQDNKAPFAETVHINGKPITVPGATAIASSLSMHRSGAYGYLLRRIGAKGEPEIYRFVINGEPTQPYAETGFMVGFSADGKHHAYAARQAKGPWKVIVDGKEHDLPAKPYAGDVQVSLDGSHWAIQVETGKDMRGIVHDGKMVAQGKSFIGTLLSADGKHLAVVVEERDATGEQTELVIADGVAHKKYHSVSSLTFSADGRLAYVARRGHKGKSVVVVDGKEEKDYGDIPTSIGPIQWGTLNWGADGRTLSYVARQEERVDPNKASFRGHVVINGQERATYEAIAPPGNPRLHIGSGSVGYVAIKGGAYYWVEERRP